MSLEAKLTGFSRLELVAEMKTFSTEVLMLQVRKHALQQRSESLCFPSTKLRWLLAFSVSVSKVFPKQILLTPRHVPLLS